MALPGWVYVGDAAAVSDTANAQVLRDVESKQYEALVEIFGPLVAAQMAADPTVRAALLAGASAAVAAALANGNAVPGIAFEDPEYAIPFTDPDGYVAGGVVVDGSAQFHNLRHKPGSVPAAALDPAIGIEQVDDDEYAIPLYDRDGYVAGGVLKDGTIRFVRLEGAVGGSADSLTIANQVATFTKSNRYRIACVGDSLTDGYDKFTGYWPDSDAWPAKMGENLPSFVTVFNRGVAGMCTDEKAIAFGAITLMCTVTGGSIPASGTFGVTIPAGIGWRPDHTWDYPGWLKLPNGTLVAGTLTRTTTATTALTFTRSSSGSAIPVSGPVQFVSAEDVHREDTVIIFLGRNDVTYGTLGTDGTVVDHVVNSTKKIVDYLTSQVKHVLLVGTINSINEPVGTANYTQILQINTQLAALYPGRFYDLRNYLVKQAIYDIGITPTSADLDAMAPSVDTMPPSILPAGETGHFGKPAAAQIGRVLAKELVKRGWV